MITREKIVEKALALFNQKGIEYVGMRELAAALEMRIGNITYYFPTKDDLVMELVQRLGVLNTQTINANCTSFIDFFGMYKQTFYNQHQYRCLFLSFVHLVTQNPLIGDNYKKTEKKRKEMYRNHFNVLVSNGYLKRTTTGPALELIISHFSLISRFWLSESSISYPDNKTDDIINHYLGLMRDVLMPHATSKGKKEIAGIKDNKIFF